MRHPKRFTSLIFIVAIWGGLAVQLAWVRWAHGATLCPSVSDNVSILMPTITGAPKPVDYAAYDLETSYLTIAYTNRTAQMLIGVPRSLITGHQTVPWAAISHYPSAIMQEKSTCPLLTQAGVPIWRL